MKNLKQLYSGRSLFFSSFPACRLKCVNNDGCGCRMSSWSVKSSALQNWQFCQNVCTVVIGDTFFHCSLIYLLCKQLKGYMVHILDGKFFFLEASYVCNNMVSNLTTNVHCVPLFTWHDLIKEKLFQLWS